jgi:chromosome segregation ATPase
MDERRNKIRDLETKKSSDNRTRNQLLEGLGEALLRRIGDNEPFTNDTGDAPGSVLAEYRKLQKEIDESHELIKTLEKEVLRLKELEETISAREEEKSRLEEGLEEVHASLGKTLLENPNFEEEKGIARRQEEALLDRINEHELKLEELEKREGGILVWLGKSAQITVSKTILVKNRAALKQLYRTTGEKFLFSKPVELLEGEIALTAGKVMGLREQLSSLGEDLAGLKGDRRKIGEIFGADGSPSRRIHGLEKHIAHVKGKFPDLYLRMGSLVTDEKEKALLSSFLSDEDTPVLEKAAFFKSQIANSDLEIDKLKVSINIDNERAAIEKMEKGIKAQQHKITLAQEVIADFERQITETEKRIVELKAFLEKNAGT